MKSLTAFKLLTFVTLMCYMRTCHSWTFSVVPNRLINNDSDGPKYHNEGSFFKMLSMDDKSILIGARNNVYNLSLTNLVENVESRIEWQSSVAHKEMCMLKGKNSTDCENYVRIFARVSDHQILLCGTNSFKPACRYYKVNPLSGSIHEMVQEFEGEAISPYSPNQNNTYIFTSDLNELYTATTVGFAGSQQLIYRQRLLSAPPSSYTGISPQTLRTESRYDILNQASFVNTMEYNGYVLFFFREQAVENQNCKSMYSRVARVCKNDKGGSHSYNDRFSSFLKTRLNCSMPGEFPFYFDEIQATSNIIDGIYGNDKDSLIYTVMTTNDNAIDGSAVCVYSMNSILAGFEGRFKNQRDAQSVWRPLDESELPKTMGRPGQCVDDSRTLPMASVNFVLKNPLMHGVINPIHDAPLLVHTGSNYKFTSIAVDPQVETMSGKIYDIMFIGTDNGQVLKVINAGSTIDENQPIVVSEQQVLPLGTRIKELKISQATQTLVIIADDYIKVIPLHNCTALSQCSQCIGSRDPYCVWDNLNRECIFYNKTAMSKSTQIYVESIDGRNDDICGDAIVPSIAQQQKPKLQSHGIITGKGSASSALPSDSESNKEEVDYHQRHKYHGVTVIQAPVSQNAEHFEPRLQTSSASIIMLFAIAALIFGIIIGVAFTKCSTRENRSASENHRNHLGAWPVPSKQLKSLPILNNGGKDINLLMNANATNKDSKKDNLELEFSLGNKDKLHECKTSNESLDKETCKSAVISAGGGTLQKVKKTYI